MADIEEHIRKAIEEGKFKDLPGQGKRLHLENNPHEDPEWRAANHMLKNAGYTLPWIETRQEVDQALEKARADLALAWAWRHSAYQQGQPRYEVEPAWERAQEAFRNRVVEINKKIFSHNIEVPSTQLQMLPIQAEREIERITRGGTPAV